ncbi:MAG: DUF2975 domain-containing protein [Oscillospiraceae bacterium]|nr:DUF2975 domain-containing protein [Oscillospiraceae bacterium]MBQ9938408.1 DUF2975 domain-containing protein [Oscillospiraceae bacterium]
MNEKKLVNSAKTFDTVAKVCGGIFRVVAIVLFVFAVLVIIFGNKMYEVGSFTLDLDFVKIYLADKYQTADMPMQIFTVVSLAVVGGLLFAASYVIKLLRDILKPMKEGRPFEESTPKKLRTVAWIELAGGFVLELLGIAERMVTAHIYPMEEIFSSSAIANVEYAYTMDFGFVLVFCVIMVLSYIFSYGQKLQRESDETL